MELKDTIKFMESEDYKERFLAEYYQLEIRYDKLSKMIDKLDRNELNFNPTCSKELYLTQLEAMADYLMALESRAKIEKIELI